MANAHSMVAHVATEMAQAVYEDCAKDNFWYAMNPDRAVFVKAMAPEFIETARGVLAEMLTRPNVTEKEKEAIHEALTLDRFIPRGVAN